MRLFSNCIGAKVGNLTKLLGFVGESKPLDFDNLITFWLMMNQVYRPRACEFLLEVDNLRTPSEMIKE